MVLKQNPPNFGGGGGGVCQEKTTGGKWTSEKAGFHINYLELLVMFLALQSILRDKTNVAVLVRSDNHTAIAYLNKVGSLLRSHLCQLALEIWGWCLLHHITLHAEYLAGKDNVLADYIAIMTAAIGSFCHQLWSCPPPAGSLYNRSVWEQNKFTTARLLQLEVKPAGESSWYFLNFLFIVPSLSYSSSMACPSVVLSSVEDVNGESDPTPRLIVESTPEASSPDPRELDVFSHVACLRQAFSTQGFSDQVAELLLQSWQTNTHRACNSAWSNWYSWCAGRHVNPLSGPLKSVLQFFTDQIDLGLQYRSLNTLRSAILTSHPQLDNVNEGAHPLVSRLLKGMFNHKTTSSLLQCVMGLSNSCWISHYRGSIDFRPWQECDNSDDTC